MVTAISAGAANSVPKFDVLIQREGQFFRNYRASADTDAARATAVRDAISAAVAGDVIHIGPISCDFGGAVLNFPANVTIKGAGQERTYLLNSVALSTGYCFTVADGTVLEDLWIAGTPDTATPMAPLAAGANNMTATLRRCKVTGESDALYSWLTGVVINCEHCYFYSSYDTIAGLGGSLGDQTFNLYDCECYSDPNNATTPGAAGDSEGTTDHSGNCVNMASGYVNAYHCRFISTGKAATLATRGFVGVGTAVMTARDCTFSSTGAIANYDADNLNGTATIRLTGGRGTNSNGTYLTNGTITFQDHLNNTAPTATGLAVLGGSTQTANRIFAGPTSGSAAAPTFRAAVEKDTPARVTVGGVTLTGVTFKSGFTTVANGTATCYTCPAGKRAVVMGWSLYNNSGGTLTYNLAIDLGGVGTWYKTTASTTLNDATNVNGAGVVGFIFEAGDKLALVGNRDGGQIIFKICEFDNTNGLACARADLTAGGDILLYTCPSGYTVLNLDNTYSQNGQGRVILSNESTASRAYISYVPQNSTTAAIGNKIGTLASLADGAISANLVTSAALVAGDSVVVNTSGTGKQLAWMSYIIFPTSN